MIIRLVCIEQIADVPHGIDGATESDVFQQQEQAQCAGMTTKGFCRSSAKNVAIS
jgi:hypothetical protein